MTDLKYITSGGRFYACKYGLSRKEAEALVQHKRGNDIVVKVERWRDRWGFAANSPLTRGYLIDLISGTETA